MTVPSVDTHGVVSVKSSHFQLYTYHRRKLNTLNKPVQQMHSQTCFHAYTVVQCHRQGIQISTSKCNLQLFHYLWRKNTLKSWIPGCSLPTTRGLQIHIKECRQKKPSLSRVLCHTGHKLLPANTRGDISSCALLACKKIAV